MEPQLSSLLMHLGNLQIQGVEFSGFYWILENPHTILIVTLHMQDIHGTL
jgi:hypothetical protein